MRHRIWMAALAAWLALQPGLAAGQEGTADPAGEDPQAAEILSRLDARLAGLRSLEGAFIQTFVSSGLGIPQTEEGRFYIRRPDLMRWEYRKPEEKLAISDGTSTWLYLPEEKTVYRGSVSQWKEGGAFSVLAGGSLVAEYLALGVGVEGAGRPGDVVIRLKPRFRREQFEFLNVEFDPGTLAIHALTAVDGMGNRVSILFSGVKENEPIQADRFRFEPPRGAQIIEQGAPVTPADVTGGAGGGG